MSMNVSWYYTKNLPIHYLILFCLLFIVFEMKLIEVFRFQK
jgi:hypothetical protein